MRRISLEHAAFFARHFQTLRHPRSPAATACDAPAGGRSRRPPRSAPAREGCGSSGLRSLGDQDVRVVQEPLDGRGREALGHQLVKPGRVNVRRDRD
jgi:hypothetical protein